MWADIPPPYVAPAYLSLAENSLPAASAAANGSPKDEQKQPSKIDANPAAKPEAKSAATAEIKPEPKIFSQKLGRCFATNSAQEITPTEDADQYYARYVRGSGAHEISQKPDGSYLNTVILEIQAPPAHGTLVQVNPKAINQQKYVYKYEPTAYFDGDDQFSITLESGDKRVQIVYTLSVGGGPTQIAHKGIDGLEDGMVIDPTRCSKEIWKISAIPISTQWVGFTNFSTLYSLASIYDL